MNKKINIVTIWGWNGSYWILSAIRKNENYNISAVISMSDNWGSTWILRKEFWILPPWDVRRGIMALSGEHEIVKELFNYRYDTSSSVSGHNLWNLIIAAMSNITGSFESWLKQVAKMFRVKGRVLPVTYDFCDLNVELKDWTIIKWETNIDLKLNEYYPPIKKAFLTPKEVKANPRALQVISKADYIIICFWDLYTSVVPNFLVKWIKKAIKKNKNAKIIYFCNLMTKPGETTDFEAIDFVNTLEKYIWENVINYFIVNNSYISERIVEKYKLLEKKKPVKVKNPNIFKKKSYTVIEADLAHEADFIRHSYDKINKLLKNIIEENEKLKEEIS
jgi:uncharacterized cofD-like protein